MRDPYFYLNKPLKYDIKDIKRSLFEYYDIRRSVNAIENEMEYIINKKK